MWDGEKETYQETDEISVQIPWMNNDGKLLFIITIYNKAMLNRT